MDTTYAHAQANLASLCDYATSTLEPVVIRRRGAEDVVLIAASELRSLEQTLHELRSPRNAARLFAALARAVERETPPRSVEALREG